MSARTLALFSLFLMAAAPFNFPVHRQVAPIFHNEAIAFAAAACYFLFQTLSYRRLQLGAVATWAAAAIVLTCLSALVVPYVYASQWIWPLVFFLAVLFVSHAHDAAAKEEVLLWLAAGLVAGAVWNSVAGWFQVVHWAHNATPWFGFFGYTGEIDGNIGHQNVYSHYLSLGTLAAVWLSLRPQLGAAFRWAALGLALWLMFSATLAGSRSTLLYLLLWGATSAWIWATRREPQALARRIVFLVVAGVAFQFSTSAIKTAIGELTGEPVTMSAGVDHISRGNFGERRIVEMKKAAAVFMDAPLTGAGWGGYAQASFELQSRDEFRGVVENGLFEHSHNIVTQLAAEMGLLGLGLLIGPLLVFFWALKRTDLAPENLLFASLALGTTALHSLVEMPLWYLHFLLVFAVLFGLVAPASKWSLPVPRPVALLVGLVSVLGVVFYSQKIERLHQIFLPDGTASERRAAVQELAAIRDLPGLDAWGDAVLINHMSLAPEHDELRQATVSRSVAYRPYEQVQLKWVCELGRLGATEWRQQEYRKLVNAYPVERRAIDDFLAYYRC